MWAISSCVLDCLRAQLNVQHVASVSTIKTLVYVNYITCITKKDIMKKSVAYYFIVYKNKLFIVKKCRACLFHTVFSNM